MTGQQINLYRIALSTRPQKRRTLMWRVAVFGLMGLAAGYCALLAGDAVYTRWTITQVAEQHARASQKISELKSQMVAPDGADATTTFAALNERLARAQQDRASLEQLIAAPGGGFSSTFVALARQHLQGLWLTQIDRGADIASLHVKGRAIDPALVPKFVQKLARETALHGASFQQLKIYLPDDTENVAEGVVEFVAGKAEEGGS